MTPRILVLGGYGGTGRVFCRELLKHTDARVIVAGRRKERAESLASELNRTYPGDRVEVRAVDAADPVGLRAAFRGVDIVLVAATTTDHALRIAEAALDAGADYLDIYFKQDVMQVLEPLAVRGRDADRCFVTQAGFHPGLPAAYLRKGVGSFDRCDTARVAMVMNERVEDPYSLIEIVDMVADFRADVFENGAWRAATWRDAVPFDFGPGFGRKKCYPMDLVEVRSLPAELGLRNAGVYVAGFNWFTDYVVFPLVAMAFAIRKGLLRRFWSRALTWGVNTFGSDRHGVVFLLQADGELAGRPAHLEIRSECDSAYDFTVIPVVACLMQVLDRSVRRPGIHMMGHLVDPDRLLADMERMGVRHRIEWTPAVPSETRTSP